MDEKLVENGSLDEADMRKTRKLKPNPMTNAGFFSRVSFSWLNAFFKYGSKNTLLESDMLELEDQDKSIEACAKLEKYWNEELENEKNGGEANLTRAIRKTHGWNMLKTGLFFLTLEISRLCIPLLLGGLLRFIEEKDTAPVWHGYAYASGIGVLSTFTAIVWQRFSFRLERIGWHLRTSICTLMYKKTLRLSQKSISEATTGKIVNLSSTDVLVFDYAAFYSHFLWITPFSCIFVAFVVWRLMGIAVLAGIGSLLLIMISQICTGAAYGKIRALTVVITDKRIRLMNEIIAGMRIIKMYVWEKPFAFLVNEVRRNEIKKLFHASLLISSMTATYVVQDKIITFVTIGVYIALGGVFTASQIFPMIGMYQVLRVSAGYGFVTALSNVNAALVSISRTQTYLLLEEVSIDEKEEKHYDEEPFIEIEDLSACWDKKEDVDDNKTLTLEKINIRVDSGKLLAIIGPVGSGKSSILSAILGQLPTCGGSINVNGQITFANQVPWVFSGSVKENILFGESYDPDWYQKVIYACALVEDVNSLPSGDQTLVGERGVTLSGGQKARVNLARAVYRKDASICLLDDPLSAVDAAVGNHIFQHCISGLLKDKVCILVTHQLHFLMKSDEIIIMKEGKIANRGTYQELQADGTDFASLLQIEEREDFTEEENLILSNSVEIFEKNEKINHEILSDDDDEVPLLDDRARNQTVPEELRKEGNVAANVYHQYLRDGSSPFVLILSLLLFLLSTIIAIITDWWIAFWSSSSINYEKSLKAGFYNESVNQTSTQSTQFIQQYDPMFYLMIFGVAVFGCLIFAYLRTILVFRLSFMSNEHMHDKMFKSLLRAPIRHFDINPVGRILNRFSKDMGQIDEQLPLALGEIVFIVLTVLAAMIFICVFNYMILLLVIPLLVYFLWIRRYYLQSGNDMKRLEGITRSPVFSLLSSTLDGMITIRALRAENEFKEKFYSAQDLHSASWFLYSTGYKWLGFRLDFVSALFTTCVSYLCIATINLIPVSPGIMGLILTYSISLIGIVQYMAKTSAVVDNLMTSVERIQQYYKIPPEADNENANFKPEEHWPEYGAVTFENVSLAYYKNGPSILKNIQFEVKAYEKVGIVGRTGAGKSSLISALFRLTELTGGEIFIDGIPITPLGLNDLRKVISIIPQDPVLFTGTMRYNLDPFSHYDDEELWNALEQVQLKEVVESLPLKLSSELAESGSNFSVGQRQLVCLARAVLRKSKILVIDEATANVDLRTDRLIQLTIREKFKHCTVLTIAHRLNTIIDSDRVMVMDAGQLKEFDEPYILLQDSSSLLSKFAAKTKGGQLEVLKSLAEEAHVRRINSNHDEK